MGNEQIFLTREGHFDAAHNLVNYEGACSRMHGHRWVVKAIFGPYSEADLDKAGIAIDFKFIKAIMADSIDTYDHQYLNNFFERPSAEMIGLAILRDMQRMIEGSIVLKEIARLYAVEVFESPESCCRIEA